MAQADPKPQEPAKYDPAKDPFQAVVAKREKELGYKPGEASLDTLGLA